jgi:arginine utilization regulatory protein
MKETKRRLYRFDDIIGAETGLLKTVERARKIASTSLPVLIYGETGTGKEMFAQSIHSDSDRKDKPFVAQNCAAIPANLLEGILFGTEKGGFTGAVDRIGLFEQANGGSLLLDEISELPQLLQSKLLRVIQEGYIRRIGGTKDVPVDVRIIASTNKDIISMIKRGEFRSDLYYRLSVTNLKIPPLRDRTVDIPEMVHKIIHDNNSELDTRIEGITEAAMNKLKQYPYPGNYRELKNTVLSAMIMTEHERIEPADLVFNK